MGLYTSVFRPLLFHLDAEWIHDRAISAYTLAGHVPSLPALLGRVCEVDDPRLRVEVCGLQLRSPLGLAAGFDKSGRAVRAMSRLGFGHIEIGSISADPSAGNPKPRLWRLPADEAILVHYGLPNDGAAAVAERLVGLRGATPVGVNVVSTNRGMDAPADTDDEIIDDYVRSVRVLKDRADYLTLNLSCPNTETGRDFYTEPGNTRRLLASLEDLDVRCPVFLKVSPLGGVRAIERVLAEVEGSGLVSGFAVNLPPGQPDGLKTPPEYLAGKPGAVSGRPVQGLTDEFVRECYRRMDRARYRLIGGGGVFTAEDAYRKIRLGASLVQFLTALLYRGPGVVRAINRGLGELVERDGLAEVAEAVGVDAGA